MGARKRKTSAQGDTNRRTRQTSPQNTDLWGVPGTDWSNWMHTDARFRRVGNSLR